MDASPILLTHWNRFPVNLIYFAKSLNLMFIELEVRAIRGLGSGSRFYHGHL